MSDFFTARFVSQGDPRLRDARGRYVKAQARLARENQNAAQQVQKLVVTDIASKIKRRKVSSDRLVNATGSSGNIAPPKSGGWKEGFAVGIPSYLDNSQAKYWRTIEEGTEVAWRKRSFIGLELSGSFGESIAGIGSTGWGSRVFAGPRFTKPGKGTGGKFVPHSKKIRSRFKGKTITVRHNIEPQHAYRDAWRAYDGNKRVRRNMESLLKSLTGKGEWA